MTAVRANGVHVAFAAEVGVEIAEERHVDVEHHMRAIIQLSRYELARMAPLELVLLQSRRGVVGSNLNLLPPLAPNTRCLIATGLPLDFLARFPAAVPFGFQARCRLGVNHGHVIVGVELRLAGCPHACVSRGSFPPSPKCVCTHERHDLLWSKAELMKEPSEDVFVVGVGSPGVGARKIPRENLTPRVCRVAGVVTVSHLHLRDVPPIATHIPVH
mmetsp:Transcript_71876/g.150167  ORF Transcript_71876/g.150167 Transcript_71876/m.150167 type:complete len:216 (-) Transcript_71876:682-1329(-)